MFVIKSVRFGRVFLVPAIISGLLSADQQDGASTRIERIEHTIGSAGMLNPEFAHVAVL